MASRSWNLDVLAQQPRLNRLYTQLTFCFETPNRQHDQAVSKLRRAAGITPTKFPWTAGEVIHQDGKFTIRETAHAASAIPLEIKDSNVDFRSLAEATFPFSMLDESWLSGLKTLATSDATKTALPVMAIQANLLNGGILLTFAGQHGAMDMAGMSQLIYLFSKACRDEAFTEGELLVGNTDRSMALSGQDFRTLVNDSARDAQQSYDETETEDKTESGAAPTDPPTQYPKLVWSYFTFSSSSLSSLKTSATADDATPATDRFISTDDALSAFTWLSMTRARCTALKNGQAATIVTTLSRNVDMRRHLSLPPTYPGIIVHSTSHTFPVEDLLQQSVGQIALQLRSALDRQTLMQQFATQVAQIEHDSTQSTKNTRAVPQLELRLSSWSKEKCYDFDFGFGKPVCVRRPAFYAGAREGLVYFLPKDVEGGIAVGICLNEEDMEALRSDEAFTRFCSID